MKVNNRFLVLIVFLMCFGCNDTREQMSQTKTQSEHSTHEKFGWEAESFFDDPDVINLCAAIEANDVEEMRSLIEAGANVNAIGRGGMTPLMWAFPDGKIERFKFLLEAGADPNVYLTSDLDVPKFFEAGDTITHMVCRSRFEAFDHVFKNGGDPNLPSKKRRRAGITPIFSLLKSGGSDVKRKVKVLLDLGVDVNQREPSGTMRRTPVMIAAGMFAQYDVALFLLESGADPTLYQDDYLYKLTHLIAISDKTISLASPQQKADYEKLIAWLEDHGESMQVAEQDRLRLRSYIENHSEHERKKLFRQEAERNRKRFLEKQSKGSD